MIVSNKKILITGISGFVGSNLAKHLLNYKANVFGLVRRRTNNNTPENIKFLKLKRN